MASPASGNEQELADLDRELDEWLTKQAAEQGLDMDALRTQELDTWKRWKENPTQEDFEQLYESHKPVIYRAGEKYLMSAQLPKSAVKSDMLRNYITSLDKYDPSGGASLSTYIFKNMQHTGRYLTKYQNVGKIPENRSRLIGLFQSRDAYLRELLGREPSNAELADDMTTSLQDVGDLQKEVNKITPRTINTLKKEIRRDLIGDVRPKGESLESSRVLDHLIFMHGSLNPEQQVVLEHTPFQGEEDGTPGPFGKPVYTDAMQLAPIIKMSPQKIRSVRKQIFNKVKRYY